MIRAFQSIAFLLAILLFGVLFGGCGGSLDQEDADDHSPLEYYPNDASNNQDDDIDDDSDDDVDDDTEDDDDRGLYLADSGLGGVQVMWCQNLGTVPPESGWVWKERILGQWEYEGDGTPQGFVTYSGDTLYAQWGGYVEAFGSNIGFLGRLKDGQWTQWQIDGPETVHSYSAGLVADSDGGVWTVLFAPYDNEVFPTKTNIVRWEEGQIAEVIPVFDDVSYWFNKLFIHQDGRFAFTHLDGSFTDSLVEQTSEGDFISISNGVPGILKLVPDSEGVWHNLFSKTPFPILFESAGTAQSGFQIKPIGFTPYTPSGFGSAGVAIDPDGVIYSTEEYDEPLLDYYYLIKYDGTVTTFTKWTETDRYLFGSWPIMGMNNMSQPYFIVAYDLPDELPENRLCMLTHTDNGTSGELISPIDASFVSHDVACSDSNELALIGYNSDGMNPKIMTLFYRQRDEKGNGN